MAALKVVQKIASNMSKHPQNAQRMYLFVLLALVSTVFGDDPKIDVSIQTNTTTATIRGYAHPFGRSWRGIPYAVAPLAQNRFKNAQLLDPSGFMTALGYGSQCVQGNSGSENCLFLNVFAPPNSSVTDKMPVYVWIHGGGFIEGSGNLGAGIYPDLVTRGPMVMVSINYRLGPFGFFTTRDSIAPGNFAVSDWIEALNWVQRYISFFGGDPKRVTVGGQSSGAEAVSFISLTAKANALYSQLILESGSAFGAAVMSYSERTRNTSEMLAATTGCGSVGEWSSGSDFGPILNCLRGLTADQIVTADNKIPYHRMKWAPVADKTYFPQRLEHLALQRPAVPVLIGDVHDEWLGWEMWNINHALNTSTYTQNGLKNALATSYEMTYWDNEAAVLMAADNKYINNQPIDANDHVGWMAKTIQLYSEMVFIGPVLRDAKYFASRNPSVYLYSFDYLSPAALPDIKQSQLRGVPHSWELNYIYDTNCNGYTCTKDDNTVREYTSQMWTNFILTGNPTPSSARLPFVWPKLDWNDRYLSITPFPQPAYGFHPDSTFWACTAPTMDGYKPPMC